MAAGEVDFERLGSTRWAGSLAAADSTVDRRDDSRPSASSSPSPTSPAVGRVFGCPSTWAKCSTVLSYVEVNLHHQCVTRRLHRGQIRRLRLGQSGSSISLSY